MELKEVVSSNIKTVAYDDDDLYIEYIGGSKYKYMHVPRNIFEGIITAESKGKYINSEVKGKYQYEKVVDTKAKK